MSVILYRSKAQENTCIKEVLKSAGIPYEEIVYEDNKQLRAFNQLWFILPTVEIFGRRYNTDRELTSENLIKKYYYYSSKQNPYCSCRGGCCHC